MNTLKTKKEYNLLHYTATHLFQSFQNNHKNMNNNMTYGRYQPVIRDETRLEIIITGSHGDSGHFSTLVVPF